MDKITLSIQKAFLRPMSPCGPLQGGLVAVRLLRPYGTYERSGTNRALYSHVGSADHGSIFNTKSTMQTNPRRPFFSLQLPKVHLPETI